MFEDLEITIQEFKTKEVVKKFKKEGTFDAVKVKVVKTDQGRYQLCISNAYPESENVWVWARDVVDRLDLRFRADMKECPIEYFATYFEIELSRELVRDSALTRKIRRGDLLSFGRQRFMLNWIKWKEQSKWGKSNYKARRPDCERRKLRNWVKRDWPRTLREKSDFLRKIWNHWANRSKDS